MSEMHSLAYGSLILLQFPPHLFTLILKEKKTGSLLFTSIIFGLASHPQLFIEIYFREFILNTLDLEVAIVAINTFLVNPNILYYAILVH